MKEQIITLVDFNDVLYYTFFVVYASIGFWKSAQDTVTHHFSQSVFNNKWFNPQFFSAELSWVRKYKNLTPDGRNIINKEPKFFLSRGLFVIFTDAFHLFYAFQATAYFLTILGAFYLGSTFSQSISKMLLATVIGHSLNKVAFQATFHALFIKEFYTNPITFLKKEF